MSLGRRSGLAAMALLLLSVGFAMAYWGNDELRATVSSVPDWIKQQRDLDAKLTRVLDTLEKLPGAKQIQNIDPSPAPSITAPTPTVIAPVAP